MRARRPHQLAWTVLAALVAVALLALLAARFAAATHAVATNPARPLSGQPAPNVIVSVWNGKQGESLSLASLHGHAVVLNFWASWCEACQQESPLLDGAWRQYHAQGVMFMGAALDTSPTDGAQFLRQYAMPYPAGAVPTQATLIAYHLIGLPATMFINREGIIVSRVDGQLTAATLANGLRAVLG